MGGTELRGLIGV